jgi:2-polyprenyl-6-methoxyphenol hydroxylase-like FAD-dependent oxidoreductase
VLFSSGLSDGGELITKWVRYFDHHLIPLSLRDLPSPDEWRTHIKQQNDGSMPREPYQRCSQAVFEAWLKPQIQAEPLITSVFGTTFETLIETDNLVDSRLADAGGEMHVVKSKYVVGCDGAGSRVRLRIGGTLIGGRV